MSSFRAVGPVTRGSGNSQSFTVTPSLPAGVPGSLWLLVLARNFQVPTGDPIGTHTVSADWTDLGEGLASSVGAIFTSRTRLVAWWSTAANPDPSILIEHANAYSGGPWAAFVAAYHKTPDTTLAVAGTQTRDGASGATPTNPWTYTTTVDHTNVVVSCTAPFGDDDYDTLNSHTVRLADLQATPVSPGGRLDVFLADYAVAAGTIPGPTLDTEGRFVQRAITGLPLDVPRGGVLLGLGRGRRAIHT